MRLTPFREKAGANPSCRGYAYETGGLKLEQELQRALRSIQEILERGNTAEVKNGKDGILVLEVRRTIRKKPAL